MRPLPKVCIDIGHGGPDPTSKSQRGAVYGTAVESELNLETFWDLLESMQDLSGAVELVSTRVTEDEKVSFAERGRISRDCLFTISIHHNAAPHNEAQRGAEVYYLQADAPSKRLAQVIARAMPSELWGRKYGARVVPAKNDPATTQDDWLQNPINVMSPHRRNPVVLVECAYLSNEQDRAFITQPLARLQVVTAIRAGIIWGLRKWS